MADENVIPGNEFGNASEGAEQVAIGGAEQAAERVSAQRPVVRNSQFGGTLPPPPPPNPKTQDQENSGNSFAPSFTPAEPLQSQSELVQSQSAEISSMQPTETLQVQPTEVLQAQPTEVEQPYIAAPPQHYGSVSQAPVADSAQAPVADSTIFATAPLGATSGSVLAPPISEKSQKGPGWLALISAVLIATLLGGALGVGVMTLRYNGTRPVSLATSEAQIEPVVNSSGEAPDWEAIAATVGPSVVSIQVRSANAQGSGSGVIIDQKGYVLTNEHVISGAQDITVTLSDGRLYTAEIMGEDASTDLAVIKIQNPPDNLSVAALGNSDELKVGQAVTAIGNPLGLSSTMTTGIISALNRPVVTSGAEDSTSQQTSVVTNAVQVDAAINPGNSGGPVFDAQGRVVAIASSIASTSSINGSTAGNIGIGFGIPINLAKNISAQLIENGVAEHAYLGVRISDGVAEYGSESRLGAVVRTVESGTPAAEAKLQPEDVIISVDGKDVVSGVSLTGYIRQYKSGDKVTLVIARNGELQELDVTLETRKDQ
ncbi:MAG: trypsin-like peptidase domain-containing protein [Arcanobacterium sp.]|nr:trypsin-like peptidase domain-containing protein [Arcanobacterium sp.]